MTALTIIGQYGCKVRENISPSLYLSNDSTQIDTVWRSEIFDASVTPFTNGDGNVITSKTYSNPIGEIFEMREKNSGELIWKWHDYFSPEYSFRGASLIFKNDILLLSKSNNTYAIDSKSGKTIWKDRQANKLGDKSMAIDDDNYIYHGFRDVENGNRNIYIWRTKIDHLNWEEVFVFRDSVDNNRIASMNMVVAKNLKGEKLIIFTPVLFRTINNENIRISKVVAYNISLKKVEWQVNYNQDEFNLDFWKTNIIARNNKIYVFGVSGTNYFLLAYNTSDGKLAFTKSLQNYGVGLHFYKDMVIPLLNGNSPIIAYDINTGDERWRISFLDKGQHEINFAFDDSKVYKNYLISTQCGKMLAINLDNGKEVYYDEPKVMGQCLQFGLAINEEKRWFYVQDRFYINCYTLPFQIK